MHEGGVEVLSRANRIQDGVKFRRLLHEHPHEADRTGVVLILGEAVHQEGVGLRGHADRLGNQIQIAVQARVFGVERQTDRAPRAALNQCGARPKLATYNPPACSPTSAKSEYSFPLGGTIVP